MNYGHYLKLQFLFSIKNNKDIYDCNCTFMQSSILLTFEVMPVTSLSAMGPQNQSKY